MEDLDTKPRKPSLKKSAAKYRKNNGGIQRDSNPENKSSVSPGTNPKALASSFAKGSTFASKKRTIIDENCTV